MTKLKPLRGGAALTLALFAIGLTACGSSSSSSSTPASTSQSSGAGAGQSSATTSGSSGAGSLSQAAAVYQNFTGGASGAADPAKTPVTIGFFNNQGGVPSFPEGTIAAQAAVKFVNQHLGGVDGHPVQLKTCFVAGVEAQGQSCAQQFLAAKLSVIVQSNGAVGGPSFHNTIAGKIPVVVGGPNKADDAFAKNAYGLNAAIFGTDPGFVAYAQQLHAKTASLLFPGDDPVGQTVAKQLEGFLAKAQVKVTPSGFTSSSPDMLPNVVASGASRTDMTIMLTVSPSSCIAGAKALKQANVTKPIVGLFLCIGPAVKQGLGDFPAWTYVSAVTNVDAPTDAATTGYLQVMKAYAPGNANVGGNAQQGFVGVVAAVRALNHAGGVSATATQVASQLKNSPGPIPMMDPSVKYGSVPGLPGLPNLGVRLFTYQGAGKWLDASHGQWVQPKH